MPKPIADDHDAIATGLKRLELERQSILNQSDDAIEISIEVTNTDLNLSPAFVYTGPTGNIYQLNASGVSVISSGIVQIHWTPEEVEDGKCPHPKDKLIWRDNGLGGGHYELAPLIIADDPYEPYPNGPHQDWYLKDIRSPVWR